MVSVRNLCYDRLRSRRTKQEKLGMLRNETDNAAQEWATDHLDTHELLRRAMETLPEKQRTIMHLRDIENYDIDRHGRANRPGTVVKGPQEGQREIQSNNGLWHRIKR